MRHLSVATILLFCCIPSVSFASVYISEVAWMGSVDNTNAEWIELYNDGEQVDVTGWTLKAIDDQPSITLSGIIGANSYALLERTSDDTVPGVPAFLIYTGALGNTGEVLELRNESGVLVDSVDGSDDWAIGGDNDTKETLQRSGTPPVGSWTTGAPNPEGSESIQPSDDEEDVDEEEEGDDGAEEDTNTDTVGTEGTVAGESTSRSAGGGILKGSESSEKRVMRKPALTLDIGSEKTVTRGVPVTFFARAYKESAKEIVVENVEWNFGDGNTGHGREVTHTYRYDGDYVVTAVGHRSGFMRDIQDTDTIVVHVKNSDIVVTAVTGTYIEIENKSNERVNVSNYILVSGSKNFVLPQNTYILPQATLRLSSKVTGMHTNGQASLFLPGGALASVYGEKEKEVTPPPVRSYSTTQVKQTQVPALPDEPLTIEDKEFTSPELSASVGVPITNTSQESEETKMWWWIVGLVSAIATAIVAVLLIRSEQQEVIEGFYIEGDEE